MTLSARLATILSSAPDSGTVPVPVDLLREIAGVMGADLADIERLVDEYRLSVTMTSRAGDEASARSFAKRERRDGARLIDTIRALVDSLRTRCLAAEQELNGTDHLDANPRKWGLRSLYKGACLQRDLAEKRAEVAEAMLHGLHDAAADLIAGWPEGGCVVDPPCKACRWCVFAQTVAAIDRDLRAALNAKEKTDA